MKTAITKDLELFRENAKPNYQYRYNGDLSEMLPSGPEPLQITYRRRPSGLFMIVKTMFSLSAYAIIKDVEEQTNYLCILTSKGHCSTTVKLIVNRDKIWENRPEDYDMYPLYFIEGLDNSGKLTNNKCYRKYFIDTDINNRSVREVIPVSWADEHISTPPPVSIPAREDGGMLVSFEVASSRLQFVGYAEFDVLGLPNEDKDETKITMKDQVKVNAESSPSKFRAREFKLNETVYTKSGAPAYLYEHTAGGYFGRVFNTSKKWVPMFWNEHGIANESYDDRMDLYIPTQTVYIFWFDAGQDPVVAIGLTERDRIVANMPDIKYTITTIKNPLVEN